MNEKIKLLVTGEKDERIAAREKLIRDMDRLREDVELLARVRFVTYQEHVKAGFTPEQAVELCRKV